jgi:hypothetical protein
MKNENFSTNLLESQATKPKSTFNIKRRYITRFLWLLTLLSSTFFIAFLDQVLSIVLIATLVLLTGLTNLLIRYIHPRFFSFSGYLMVIVSYVLAFVKIILIPLDIGINADYNDSNNYIHDVIDLIWKIGYWSSICINFVLLRVLLVYWEQSHSTFAKRIKKTIVILWWRILVIVAISLVLLTILIIKHGTKQTIEVLLTVVQLINIAYCLIFIILLFGYGAVALPFYFFSFTDTKTKINNYLIRLRSIKKELVQEVNKFIANRTFLMSKCYDVIQSTDEEEGDEELKAFAKDIIKKMETLNLDYNLLVKYKKTSPTIKDKDKLDLNQLSEMYTKTKNIYYLAIKKEAALLRIYSYIKASTEIVNEIRESTQNVNETSTTLVMVAEGSTSFFDNSVDNSRLKSKSKRSKSIINKTTDFLTIKPKRYNKCCKTVSFLFGGFILLISLFILVLQANIFILEKLNIFVILSINMKSLYAAFSFIFFYFAFIFTCCFYSLSQLRLFESYILVPHHTDQDGMITNALMCNTLVIGIIYNIAYFFSDMYIKDHSILLNMINDVFTDMLNQSPAVLNTYKYAFPSLLIVVVVLTILKKFNILFVGNKYLQDDEAILAIDVSEQKAFKIIEKIEVTYFNKN